MINGDINYHSARRLIRVITTLQAEASDNTDSSPTFMELVASVAGMDMQNPAVLGLAQAIFELPRNVARDLRDLEGEQARYAEPGVKALVTALTPRNLQKPWPELYRDIDSRGIPALNICCLLFDVHSREKKLDEAELDKIAEDARQLLEEVRLSTSLPIDVVQYIEAVLLSLLHAIDQYWVRGSIIIEGAVDSAIGRTVREGRFKSKGSTKTILKRLGTILSRIAIVVAVANDVNTLPATVHDVVHGVIEVTKHLDSPPDFPPLQQADEHPNP